MKILASRWTHREWINKDVLMWTCRMNVLHVSVRPCPGGGGLHGVLVPRAVPHVLLGRRKTQPPSVVHLRASFDPTLCHPQCPDGTSSRGHQQSPGVRRSAGKTLNQINLIRHWLICSSLFCFLSSSQRGEDVCRLLSNQLYRGSDSPRALHHS